MQTRKDLYQAHRLMTQRLGMALLQGEPDLPESPMRRHNVASFAGILIAVLVTAGFGIWGMLDPSGATKLKDPGQLLIEAETGATYVFSQQNGDLLPVANYTSARLILDSADITVRKVSAASLAGFRRGVEVGIPGAPQSLPKPDKLVKAPWSACVLENVDSTGIRKQYVTLVGGTDVGGTPVGGQALIVNDGRQDWVLLGNHRMRVQNVSRLIDQAPRRVPPAWINAIPEGHDFMAPPVAGRGRKLKGPGGTTFRVGEIFQVPADSGTPARYYVLLSDGLGQISETQAKLLQQDPASRAAYGGQAVRPITIDAASANAARMSATKPLDTGLPATMPRFAVPGSTSPLCMVYGGTLKGSLKGTLTVGSTVPLQPPAASAGADKFDQVLLPPGSAAVVGLLHTEGNLATVQQFYLVTDQGKKFLLPTADVMTKLGYGAQDVAPVPDHLMRMVPEGPTLDPVAARTPVSDTPLIRPSTS